MPPTLMIVASQTLADRLASARIAAGHTQLECAELLTSRFGEPDRSQASLSRYLSGKQEMPIDVVRAVSEYISIFDPDEPSGIGDTAADDVADKPAQEFAGLVRRLTDEPLLGPRQGALVDTAMSRLRDGPPFSSEDRAVLESLMRILGLGV
jgi:transcriptional regulator with XRE-family HTH domain